MVSKTSIFLYLLRVDLSPIICSILENVLCAPRTTCGLSFWNGKFYKYQLRSFHLICSVRPIFLIYFLYYLSFAVCLILYPNCIFVLAFPFRSVVKALYILVLPDWVLIYWFVISLWWLVHFILIKCASLSLNLLCLIKAPLLPGFPGQHGLRVTSSLPSRGAHVYLWRWEGSPNVFLLVFLNVCCYALFFDGEFSPFIFSVIIDIRGLIIAILTSVFCLLCISIISFLLCYLLC